MAELRRPRRRIGDGLRGSVHDEEGQAVVEFALVLPIFALLLLGLLQFGLVLNTKQQLEGVARQGARTFALTGDARSAAIAMRVSARQLPRAEERTTVRLLVDAARGSGSALDLQGRLRGIALPAGQARGLRGSWVTVTVTYDYENPIQASVLGRRLLPATIPLTTRAAARVEAGGP